MQAIIRRHPPALMLATVLEPPSPLPRLHVRPRNSSLSHAAMLALALAMVARQWYKSCKWLSVNLLISRHGAEVVDRSEKGQKLKARPAFKGTGYRLGETEESSDVIAGAPVSEAPKQVNVTNYRRVEMSENIN